jgi:hydantoinase/carbamoylase family amidase
MLMTSVERIQRDIETIAGFTETPGQGATRPTFSPAWAAARDYVIRELESCGCRVRIDAAGNIRARSSAVAFETPAWLSGSHLDTVPHGGNFDGVVGVVAALEALRAAREAQKVLPVELVIWAEEEGTTFGLGMLGSRAVAGTVGVDQLATLKNASGRSYLEAGAAHGVVPEKTPDDRVNAGKYVGLIEVHVEQGPGLWNTDEPVAVVRAIDGRKQYRLTIRGVANHAGSTRMNDRFDALAGAGEVIVAMERLARELAHDSVITVGQIACKPNAINVIAEEATLSIDFRSPSNDLLARGDMLIQKQIDAVTDHRRLTYELENVEFVSAIDMDERVCARLKKAAVKCGIGEIGHTTSGALHDAAILAPLVPTAMLFVASRDGISHNADEFSRYEDVAAAATILAEAVRNRSLD